MQIETEMQTVEVGTFKDGISVQIDDNYISPESINAMAVLSKEQAILMAREIIRLCEAQDA